MPRGDHCCVPLCTNDRRYVEVGKEDKILLFHSFPGSPVTKTGAAREVSKTEAETRAKWKHAIRRDEKVGHFTIIPYETVVCSDHFTDQDYSSGEKKRGAKLRPQAVPSIFSWSTTPPPTRSLPVRDTEPPKKRPKVLKSDHAKFEAEKKKVEILEKEVEEVKAELYDMEVECCLKMFSLARFENSDSDIQYYTGFPSLDVFDACMEYLKLSDETVISSRSKDDSSRQRARGAGRKSKLSMREKFFLTMVRLRRGTEFRMLGDLYQVDTATVSRIVQTMVNYLYLRLGMMPIWPSPEKVAANLPDAFKDLYPDTFMLIDATEVKCEVPSSLPAQSQLYSSYKSHTTLKGLIGMTPDGAVCFVSELYGGAISDRELVLRSHFLELLPSVGHGKSIMADKGFDIQDLLVPHGVKLVIPPFKKSAQQMSLPDVQKTQSIAHLRIHIERLMERIKEFQVFSKIVPVTLFPIVNQMWTVCALLTLFQAPLLADTGDQS